MIKKSTRNVFRAHGWRIDRAIHYYIYFKFYQPYVKSFVIGFEWIDRVLSSHKPESWTYRIVNAIQNKVYDVVTSRYHGKVVSLGDVTKIIKVEQDVTLGHDTTNRIIPFKYAKNILLSEPDQLAVMDCPCKVTMDEPCRPVNCCIAIGRPVTDFWLEHCKKYNARRITKEEALDIITQLRKTGHFNQAFFKVATGGRMGVICNCCKKCCVRGASVKGVKEVIRRNRALLAEATMGRGDPISAVAGIAPSGYTVAYQAEKCTLCGKCVEICNFEATVIENGKRTYDNLLCLGCGLCEEHCPAGALRLVFEDKGGYIPLDLDLAKEKLCEMDKI
jgi:Pyruvate/2-oxoacid:ferredoxin oxidoreductase delta subunit